MSVGPLRPPNENNDHLRRATLKLGISSAGIMRNVKGRWNLGSCGLGWATTPRQSVLVATAPAALDRGATAVVETRVERMMLEQGRISLDRVPVDRDGSVASEDPLRSVVRHEVVAGGAINSAALGFLGRSTFLHPVVISALIDHRVKGWSGAPRTIYSDDFLDATGVDGAPVLLGFGREHSEALRRLLANACAARAVAGRVEGARRALALDGVHWQVPNVSLHDGSIFPTGIGAHPQLSIYGIVNRLATGLARLLSARDLQLA